MVQTDPDRSYRIVWMVNQMVKQSRRPGWLSCVGWCTTVAVIGHSASRLRGACSVRVDGAPNARPRPLRCGVVHKVRVDLVCEPGARARMEVSARGPDDDAEEGIDDVTERRPSPRHDGGAEV